MEDQLPYRAEYAKTGRAKCKYCKNTVGQGELRIAAMVQSSFHDGKQANWFHCDCFFHRHSLESTGEIAYFFTLRNDDQQKLKSRIESNVVVPTNDAPADKGKKRANPCDEFKDFGIEYSKSSRAYCRACQQKIVKGAVRIKKANFNSEVGMKYGGQALWHHVDCFEQIRDELRFFGSGDKLPGFDSLNTDDQDMVRNAIKAVSDAPEGKKLKKEDKSPAELVLEAELEKQNENFYTYKTALQQLSKKELRLLLTQNNQKWPENTSATVAPVDIAADLLTFGTPDKCTECTNGFYTLGNNTYSCNGALDEWAKCTNKTQDPPRTDTTIPEQLKKNHQFLNNFSGKIVKRIFQNIAPVLSDESKVGPSSKNYYPKIQREKPKLYKMIFLFVGKPTSDVSKLKKTITNFGGEVKTKLDKHVTFVISNPKQIAKMNDRMCIVESLEIPVISEDFFAHLNKDTEITQLIEQFKISDWGDVDEVIQDKEKEDEDEEWEKIRKAPKSRFTKSSKSSKVTLKIKGGAAVDPESKLESFTHVYEKNGVLYNAILSLADLQTGQNSFYKMQILQSDVIPEKFYLYRSWGRIGTTIGGNKSEFYQNGDEQPLKKFEELYLEKTKNSFGTAEFKKYPGYFNPIDTEYEPIANKFLKECNIESKLDAPIQDLIKLIFDVNRMQQTMIQFEIDTEKMPLGKLSKAQIDKALIALNELSALVERRAKKNEFISPTNRFYTLIPHNFGIKQPPILNTVEIIKQKIEMLETLLEIELAFNMLNNISIPENVNLIDAHYEQLKTQLEVLDPESDEFKMLQLYVKNTHGATHNMYDLEIQNVFKVTRNGEGERFEKYKKLHNRKLLWHGSRLTNFVGILKNGLKIAPPEAPCTGYMFGKGIYFADMVSKSANYCFTTPNENTGLLLLCDVALGNMQEYIGSHYVTELPHDKHSTIGAGQTEPDPEGSIKQGDIEIPCGKPVNGKLYSLLLYNEYIIYNIEQANVKYLLNLKFNYR